MFCGSFVMEDLKVRREWYSEMWGVESTWLRLNERRKRMSGRSILREGEGNGMGKWDE